MSYTKEEIKEKLVNTLDAVHCNVEDTSDGCGMKFSVQVVSPKFDGLPLIKRHRLVNSTLENEMKSIHALQIKAFTPEQWQKQQAS